ncbi:MAG: hypothetical protein ACLRVU_09315 [Beduini sp.]|uniref:hypothetical protein n=1 Tax=Beduini sp. TaxID=1922300 RepID=UPI0039A358B3
MKKLLTSLVVSILVLGMCSFNTISGVPCDHQHDAECGYNEATKNGCTHSHDTKPYINGGEGPTA